MAIHHLESKLFYYTFAPHPPALRVHSGDTVVAHTPDALGFDALGEPLPDAAKHRVPGTTLLEANPVVGPIYVHEATEGDLLAVHLRRIRLTRDFAVSESFPNFGSLTGEGSNHLLLYNDPVPSVKYRWQLDRERNTGILKLPGSRLHQVEVALLPFVGSIGVAPPFGRVETTVTPGAYGGNMDCPQTCEGTTLYLPVWVDGAYLSLGDVHALQGDGELVGTALEVTAEVTLEIEVLKGRTAAWPRLEDDGHIMVAGSTRPLLDCVRLAYMELLAWLVDEYGFQRDDAWQVMSQVSTIRVGNVVDPNYTVVARFPKSCLPL